MPSLMSAADLATFHADGFHIVRGMYDAEEVDLLRRAMEADPEVADHMLDRLDAHGAATRIALWNRAGDSVYGMAARCARMVDTMEALLGGPVYHFQSKLTAKEPFVGGAWEWHQDYGYWYHNGCLFPHLASCQLALDRSARENGCLQMVRGLSPLTSRTVTSACSMGEPCIEVTSTSILVVGVCAALAANAHRSTAAKSAKRERIP